MQPVFVHQFAETPVVAALQRLFDAQAELFDEMQIIEHGGIAKVRPDFLIVQHRGCVARIAGEEHHQVLFQIVKRIVTDVERRNLDLIVFLELEAGQAAVRSDVLILFTDRLLQRFDFDPAGLFRDDPGVHILALERVYGTQESHCECTGRSEPCSGRNVSHADDFDWGLNIVQPQCLPNQRVPDLLQVRGLFQSGVFQQVPATEPLVNADVDVLIDGGRDHESTKAAVVGRQVGAASAD